MNEQHGRERLARSLDGVTRMLPITWAGWAPFQMALYSPLSHHHYDPTRLVIET